MHSHGRSRRKRGHNGDADQALLAPRQDDLHSDSYSRSQTYSHRSDSYRPTPTRDPYDSNREASSSRSLRHADEWHPTDASRSSHDLYEYSSSKDAYHRNGRDRYDVSETRDSGSWANAPSDNTWGHESRYDHEYGSSSYPETSSWPTPTPYDRGSTSYDRWPADDNRSHSVDEHVHSRHVLEDRASDRDPGWHRDGHRKEEKRAFVSDSGWDSRKGWDDASGWNTTQHDDSNHSTDDRSWQPAPTWRASTRGEARNQNGNRNHHKKSKAGKKGTNLNQQKRDWRTDDDNLNNWPRRDAQTSANKTSRTPKKRKQARSPSPSRSRSLESYYSRHSRSRSRSVSPKRRRRGPSPVRMRSRSPRDRGRLNWRTRQDGQHSKSPVSSRGRATRRTTLSSASSSSRSRSSSHSPVDRPRAVHRLPPATSIKDISLPVHHSSRASGIHPPRDTASRRNGKGTVNGKHSNRSASRNDHISLKSHLPSSNDEMPPPATIPPISASRTASGVSPPHMVSRDSSVDAAKPKGHRSGPVKNAGFRPIIQASSAIKRFFPGEDDEDDASIHLQPTTPAGSRPRVVPVTETDAVSPQEPVLPRTRDPFSFEASPSGKPRQDLSTEKSNGRSPAKGSDFRNEDASLPAQRSSGPDHSIGRQKEFVDKEYEEEVGPSAENTPVHMADTGSAAARDELYAIISQVGEGTFGKVYKARNTISKIHVALKRIRMATEKDGFPVTAMREIKLLQSLRHDNVVRLYEMMVSNTDVYMVFEYMDHDLTGILSQTQFSFTDAHLKSLCHQMLNGLAYLHHKGVIHRDIKGSNILINNRGELKLADFGLARFYQKRRRSDYTNRVITLWYRPPELLFGATIYGPEVDMWSAGCIMLELFTKKPVFQGNDEIHQLDVIYKIFGTPTDAWAGVMQLPWYELVKPKDMIPNRFRDLFQKWLSPAALDLAERLLAYDPGQRVTAVQAMDAPYFKQELPTASLPVGLSTLEGEWHELETKRERAKKRRKTETALTATQ